MTTATTSLPYVSVCELVQPALDQNLFYCFMHRQSRIVFIVFVAAMAYQTFSVVFIHFHNFFCSLNRCTHIIQAQLRKAPLEIIFMLILIKILKFLTENLIDMA